MMRLSIFFACIALAILQARMAAGHGTSIEVNQAGGSMSAVGSLLDSNGFAAEISLQEDEFDEPLTTTSLSTVGPAVIWVIPGLSISGMAPQCNLFIEVLVRPVKNSNPLEQRVLWYWNPEHTAVEPAPTDAYLLGTQNRFTTLSRNATNAPPPFLLSNTMSGQQFPDNHNLLSYALDNDPSPGVDAAEGAYGFFARFTSTVPAPPDQYAPSNPVLIMFNHGMDYDLMTTAALAINAAAVESPSGDFNQDGAVDAADYVMWRKTMGSAGDYETWRETFGTPSGGMGAGDLILPSAAGATTVPEPGLSQILAIFCCVFASSTHRRR